MQREDNPLDQFKHLSIGKKNSIYVSTAYYFKLARCDTTACKMPCTHQNDRLLGSHISRVHFYEYITLKNMDSFKKQNPQW
jgi:hypothetical protein